ncbi:hypothetical protein BOX15_Mlig006899g2, partial [Macrostomum lignano]
AGSSSRPGAPPHPQQPAMSFGVGGSNGTAGSRRRSRSHSRHRDLKQPPAPTPQQLTVTLSRAPDFGLGIAVSGGIDSLPVDGGGGGDRGDEASGLFISDIIQGGPAEGRLRIGDRLLACNGVSLRRATHDAAVAELQRSHAVRLLIERRPPARLGNGTDDDDDDSAGSDDADDLPGENNGAGRSAIDLENDETGEDGAGGSSLLVHVTFVVRSPDLLNSQLVVSKSLDRVNGLQLSQLASPSRLTRLLDSAQSLSLQFRQEPQQLSPERLGNGQHRAEPVQLPAPSQHRLEPPPQPSIGAGRHRSVEALAPPPHAPTDAEQVRQVTPDPDGSIGVRLDGGNAVGIFVRQVAPGGPADRAGVRPGDRLVAVDRRSLVRATKEEALLALLPQSMPPRPLRLSVLPDPAGYRAFASGRQPGDRFHVRAHFNHAKPAPNEAVIRRGDVFLVQDTLAGGVVGAWEAVRVHPPPAEAAVSLIPNQFRAEQLAMAAAAAGRDLATAFPPYERVALRRAAFPRPVVVFGPFADIVRRHLLDSLPEKFELPPQTAQSVKLSAIKSVMVRGRHPVLDLNPVAVDRLCYAQLAPIVLLIRASNRQVIKKLRRAPGSKRLHQECLRLEQLCGHLFTDVCTVEQPDLGHVLRGLERLIDMQQGQLLWLGEAQGDRPPRVLSEPNLTQPSPDEELPTFSTLPMAGGSGRHSQRLTSRPTTLVDHRDATDEDDGEFLLDTSPPAHLRPAALAADTPSSSVGSRDEVLRRRVDLLVGQARTSRIGNGADAEDPYDNVQPGASVAPSTASAVVVVDRCSGLFDASGGALRCPRSGVALEVPPGALPAGRLRQLRLAALSLDGGRRRIVGASPPGAAFLRPLTLRLPAEWADAALVAIDSSTSAAADEAFAEAARLKELPGWRRCPDERGLGAGGVCLVGDRFGQ